MPRATDTECCWPPRSALRTRLRSRRSLPTPESAGAARRALVVGVCSCPDNYATATLQSATRFDERILSYVVKKFQRQSKWQWRMKSDGTALPDVAATDSTVCTSAETGEVDDGTAKALHAWVQGDLHIVIRKFELKELHWPPGGSTKIINEDDKSVARLR